MTTVTPEAPTQQAHAEPAPAPFSQPTPIPPSSSQPTPSSQLIIPAATLGGSFGTSVNNYLNFYINIADSKATAFLAGNLVALGVVMSQNDPSRPNAPLHLLAIACFIIAGIVSTLVLFPRLPEGGSGVIFWEDIRSYNTPDEYHQAVTQMNPQRVEQAYAYQNYHVARVLHAKHQYLRWAIIASGLGVACAVVNYWLR